MDADATNPDGKAPVFISYAHDNPDHIAAVVGFSDFLRDCGIDVQIDMVAAAQPRDWREWTAQLIRDSAFVLVIGSPEYRRVAGQDADEGERRGVRWENRLLAAMFYENETVARARVLGVVLPGRSPEELPYWLTPSGATHYRVSEVSVAGAEGLLRYLTGQAAYRQRALGRHPVLPPVPRPAPPVGDGAAAGGCVLVGDIPREPVAFVGREDLLVEMEQAAGSDRPAVVVPLTGGRGVGKTQLAAAYARRRVAQGWPLVVWLAAESADELVTGLSQLAEVVGVRSAEDDSVAAARAARGYLQRCAGPALVVADNATDADVISRWLPSVGPVQVIITTTRREFTALGAAVEVDTFTDREAVAYLARRTGLDDEPGARELAGELGCLPLGMAQAAGVIARQGLDYGTYLRRLREFPLADFLRRSKGDPYPRGVTEAIGLSVQEVAAGDPSGLAYRLLEVLAVLSPAGVDRRVLRAVPLLAAGVPGRDSDHDEEPAAHNEQDAAVVVDEAVELLADTSLITLGVNGTQAAAHRLVQRVVRERAAGRHRLASVVGLAATAIESLLVDEHQAWKARDIAAHGIQQIDALWSLAGSLDLATMDSGLAEQLVEHRNWAVRHLRTVADLTRAITTGRTVLADAQRILGADHPDTLGSRNNLAYAYRLAGRVGEAIPLFEQTLADYGRVLGAGHPYTLTSRNNLAYAYQSAGRLGEAIPLFERTLADRERILGADHPDTLTSRNDLAGAYESAGRLGETIPLYERTLADQERVLDADHPDTRQSRNDLAGAYRSAKRPGEATPPDSH